MVYQKENYKSDSALNFYLNSQERLLMPMTKINLITTRIDSPKPLHEALEIIKR